ncbi:phage holin family protein [Fictibacillus iocasae]|uniref:Phage holin family protein n=1 Tax=Fictibacillus iocasae TaxID=2715437 RepID=A0ABW2NL73_9BACL
MEEFSIFIHFLEGDYAFILPVLFLLGLRLHSTPQIPAWSIFWILAAVSMIIAFWKFGVHVVSFTNGILAAGISFYGLITYLKMRK